MTYIKWDDKHSVGVKIIDGQHQHFIGLMNALYESLQTKNISNLPRITKDLATYAKFHFKTEEDYFDKFNYIDSVEHKAAHKEMLAKVNSFVDRKGDSIEIGFDLLYFLERWFIVHFKGTDKKFADLFKQNGLK